MHIGTLTEFFFSAKKGWLWSFLFPESSNGGVARVTVKIHTHASFKIRRRCLAWINRKKLYSTQANRVDVLHDEKRELKRNKAKVKQNFFKLSCACTYCIWGETCSSLALRSRFLPADVYEQDSEREREGIFFKTKKDRKIERLIQTVPLGERTEASRYKHMFTCWHPLEKKKRAGCLASFFFPFNSITFTSESLLFFLSTFTNHYYIRLFNRAPCCGWFVSVPVRLGVIIEKNKKIKKKVYVDHRGDVASHGLMDPPPAKKKGNTKKGRPSIFKSKPLSSVSVYRE